MATAAARKPVAVVPLAIRIEATTMAVREEIMNYFKGTCVERMVDQSSLSRQRLSFSTAYQYQRLDYENQDNQVLYLGRLPILTFRKLPDTITVNTQLMVLSKGLEQVGKGLEKFLKNYLVAVEVVSNGTTKLPNGRRFDLPKVNDEKLFTAVPRGEKSSTQRAMEEMNRAYRLAYDPGDVAFYGVDIDQTITIPFTSRGVDEVPF